jgi:CubicO group peptidase (beta-lactamase class C family)
MRRYILLPVAVFIISCSSKSSLYDAENSDLAPQKEVKSRLVKHGADTFKVNLREKAFVAGNANQISMDVVIKVLDPDNKELTSIDETGRGLEPFQFITNRSGIHKLVVTPYEEQEGDYGITINKAEKLATDPALRIEQIVQAMVPDDAPGASIAVVRDGKIIFSKGFGHADLEYDVHNTPQTIFHIASVSKQFTAFAIAMLADQGKLSLDDDIRKHLPEMHDFGTPITIRQLIHHTSGLRDQWNLLAMAGWRLDDVITRNQILRVIRRQRELNFKPGDQHSYCNTGYTLMAEIVSRASGKPFTQWTQENIFTPLQMTSTQFYDDHQKIVPNRAYSYFLADTVFKKSVLSYANVGATSLFTTVEDLARWSDNFYSMNVGNEKVMAMMEQRYILNKGDTISYAFGQDIGTYKGLKAVAHSGGDAGYRSFFLRFPEQRFAVIVFSNLASFNTSGLSYNIAELYLKDLLKDEPKKSGTQSPPSAEKKEPFDAAQVNLSEFTGRFYSAELETFYDLEVRNDTLIAHHPRHDDFKLTPVKADGFNAGAWWMGNVDFTRNTAKKIDGMKVSNGRVVNLKFIRQ